MHPLRRRSERRQVLLELHHERVPTARARLRRALAHPTDLAALAALTASSEQLERAAVIAGGWVRQLARDISSDARQFEQDMRFVSAARSGNGHRPVPLTAVEVARRGRWHLQQAGDLLGHLEAETGRRVTPARSLADARVRPRLLLRRWRARRAWRRDMQRG